MNHLLANTHAVKIHHQKFWSIWSHKVWSITTKSGCNQWIWLGQEMCVLLRFDLGVSRKNVWLCVCAGDTKSSLTQQSLHCVKCEACQILPVFEFPVASTQCWNKLIWVSIEVFPRIQKEHLKHPFFAWSLETQECNLFSVNLSPPLITTILW